MGLHRNLPSLCQLELCQLELCQLELCQLELCQLELCQLELCQLELCQLEQRASCVLFSWIIANCSTPSKPAAAAAPPAGITFPEQYLALDPANSMSPDPIKPGSKVLLKSKKTGGGKAQLVS